jgi:hypothetical protein
MKLLKGVLFVGLIAAAVVNASAYTALPLFPKTDTYLVRTDCNGRIEWIQVYDFGHETRCKAVAAIRNGGFIIACEGDSCHRTGRSLGSCYLTATDDLGKIIWQKCYGPEERMDYRDICSLCTTKSGEIIVAGSKWMFCINEAGDLLWSRTYTIGNGGSARMTMPCSDGGFVMVGDGFERPNGKGHGGWALKTDAEGREQWLQKFGSGYTDYIYDATSVDDGQVVVVGEAYDEDPGLDPIGRKSNAWVVMLSPTGRVLWNREFGPRRTGMQFYNVWTAPDQELLLWGAMSPSQDRKKPTTDYVLMRLSADGDSLWSRHQDDGWIADSGESAAVGKLSREEIDEIMHTSTPHNVLSLLGIEGTLTPVIDTLRAMGYQGFMSGTYAGILSDGAFQSGWIEKTSRYDTTHAR